MLDVSHDYFAFVRQLDVFDGGVVDFGDELAELLHRAQLQVEFEIDEANKEQVSLFGGRFLLVLHLLVELTQFGEVELV